MMANAQQTAGKLMVVGLGGTELTGLERAWLKLVRPAGIILFKRNIANAQQTRALLDEATALCAPHSLRCVDVEGGTVDRLRDALAPMPSAQAVARAQKTCQDGARASVLNPRCEIRDLRHLKMREQDLPREHGELVALAVKAFGFNTTLAPVLDLALPESAEVMGTRVAASTAAAVTEYARGFLKGLAAQRVLGCGKHFPGLGGGTRDSHREMPAIERNGDQLWREDLEPYRALRNELPMVMINHASYPCTPGKTRPASVSRYWITTVLRQRIGYKGMTFSDDLEMAGILKFMPIEEAVVAAVSAGMDLIEICHSPELILRAYEALIAKAERSRDFAELIQARAQRTARLRAQLFAGTGSRTLSARHFDGLRARILKFGDRVAQLQPAEKIA